MFIRARFSLAHKHNDIRTRRMAHLTCAYAYAYVDQFSLAYTCVCACAYAYAYALVKTGL